WYQHVVHRRQTLGCRADCHYLDQKIRVVSGRAYAVLQGHAQFVGTFAEAVCVLCHVPDMLAEEQLDLHFRGRRYPGGHGLHERDMRVPHRSHEVAAFLDGQHESSSIVASMRAAVSLGGPTERRQHGMRDSTSLRIMSRNARRTGATPHEQYEI